MKKGILLILILSLVTQISFAVEVGYVDITKVVNNYALAQKYKNEVNNKFKSVSAFIDQQNKEVNSAKDEKTRIEKRKKAIAAVEAKQKEYRLRGK